MGRILSWLRGGEADKHPLLKKNEEYFLGLNQNMPVDTYEFVVLDTELTGLDPRRDEIVSIGAFRIRNLQISAGRNFFSYIRPTRELPKDSTLIHKITPEQVKEAPMPEEVWPAFVEFCGRSLIVGHFVTLDMTFINKALRKYMGGGLRNPCVDSMKLAAAFNDYNVRTRFRPANRHQTLNLTGLARQFGLPIFEQHDSLEDALETAYLFVFLVKQLREAGCVTLKDLYIAGRRGKTGQEAF